MASPSTDAAASAPDAEIEQLQAGDAAGAEQADQGACTAPKDSQRVFTLISLLCAFVRPPRRPSRLIPFPSPVAGSPDSSTAASEPAAVEVTLLVPSQQFLSLSTSPAKKTADGLLELPLPIALSDAIHDLRTIITDAPEGFWLGAFSLTPYYAEEVEGSDAKEGEEQSKQFGEWKALSPPERKPLASGEVDPTAWSLTKEGVLGDFADLTAVFGAEPEFWEGKKRGLMVTFSAWRPTMSHRLTELTTTSRSPLLVGFDAPPHPQGPRRSLLQPPAFCLDADQLRSYLFRHRRWLDSVLFGLREKRRGAGEGWRGGGGAGREG